MPFALERFGNVKVLVSVAHRAAQARARRREQDRKGTPQEVANAALFRASDESSFITGDRMICAGGRYM